MGEARKTSLKEAMTWLADTFRMFMGSTEKMTLSDMAANVGQVYNVGREAGAIEGESSGWARGLTEGIELGKEEGKQAEYDRFWDDFQQNGNRTDYNGVFYGYGWTAKTFKPKYNIYGTRFSSAFSFATALKGSLKEMLDACGVVLDTSQATNVGSMFYYATNFTEIPHIDLSSVTSTVSSLFHTCHRLVRIEKVTYTENSACYHNNAYNNCTALTDIEFDGVIAGDMNFEWSPLLSEATLQSLISHLKDLTGATKKILKFHADIEAKLTAEQKATISALNWTLVFA